MRYTIEEYNSDGFLKAPIWLWLGWLLLAKAWIVFVVAGASRNVGATLLEIIYPVHSTLYIGLVAGFPAITFMWLLGLRKTERKLICRLLTHGKSCTIFTVCIQLILVSYQIYLDDIQFNWPNAITLVSLLWLLIYVVKSRRVRDCFRSPLLT
ncbi:DUF2919 domain-containing protein [Vibrio sp. TH_r3]|uniref:DUF2919 domain-containing protein n=1 Tax=Vibrio sp. TH_r3 TaxID=3082084 RepID=UPI002955D3DC|nr:DUF2919 domain-containing protein [Vibrio sp. TH_r3]MDV7105083.1 DUF2919 domain-containing protein [Vibrio sp. TH_r3]